ncbi:MAG: hypothetical protein AAB377_03015 [Patescibacteria group bacterium]
MNFSKKKIIGGLIILVLLAAGGYWYWMSTGPAREVNSQKELETISSKVFELARSGDSSRCKEINYTSPDGVNYHEVCVNNAILEAVKNGGDINLCSGVAENFQKECRQIGINLLVENKQDESVCTTLQSAEDISNCKILFILKNALVAQNPQKCSSLTDENSRKYCTDSIWFKKLAAGEKVSCLVFADGSYKKDCDNFQKAASSNKISCSLVQDISLQISCMNAK